MNESIIFGLGAFTYVALCVVAIGQLFREAE